MSEKTSYPKFTILKETEYGRLGKIETAHGDMLTPGFFFCATHGALRGASTATAKEMKTQGILSNTYHLMQDSEIIANMGGLHKFLAWDGPIMTDSGGFQIFSLGHGSVAEELKRRQKKTSFVKKITKEGVYFRHIRDGSLQYLTPAKAMQIQRHLNSDLIFVLDECTPFHVTKEYTYKSLQLTKKWAEESLAEFSKDPGTQGLYGIVQGGIYPEFRAESIEHLNSHPFFGYGIGGSLGANRDDMIDVLGQCSSFLKPERPVHLLGIGKVQDIIKSVPFGIDTFDCVHPTRLARHGAALVSRDQWIQGSDGSLREHIVLTNNQYKNDPKPIDENCKCSTCKTYSKAYLNHLFKRNEMLGTMLVVAHNMHFMNTLMEEVRDALQNNTYPDLAKRWLGMEYESELKNSKIHYV